MSKKTFLNNVFTKTPVIVNRTDMAFSNKEIEDVIEELSFTAPVNNQVVVNDCNGDLTIKFKVVGNTPTENFLEYIS